MSDLKRKVDIQSVPLFVSALPVLQTLKEAGHEAVFVGGSVRDLVLGKEFRMWILRPVQPLKK